MKIVIDIDDLLYEYISKGRDLSPQQYDKIELAIVDGTPLPKGHGKLIDADKLMELAYNCVTKTVDCNDIARFPTVIEAKK